MPRRIPKLYKHTQLIEKEVAGVIDHADGSVADSKLTSGVGLLDTQICKLPVAAADKVLKRGPEAWIAGDVPTAEMKVAIGTFQREGLEQQITGLGFQPKVLTLIAISMGGVTEIWSMGFDNATAHSCQYKRGDEELLRLDDGRSMVAHDGTNYMTGYVSSMDTDGFTVVWSLVEGGLMVISVVYLALG